MSRARAAAVLLVALAAGCGGGGSGGAPPGDPTEPFSGGATTVFNTSDDAFSFPAANLSVARSNAFFVGNSFFNSNWTIAPASANLRDGLGPVFNSASCSGCHPKDGRGRPPTGPGDAAPALLVRLSVPGTGPDGGPLPEPTYGDQLQPRSIPGVPAEGAVEVSYVEEPGAFADGAPYSLRRPAIAFPALAFGPLAADVLTSARQGQPVFGLGLLGAVPEAAIVARADEPDQDGDGISGRPNYVHDLRSGLPALGRFGWKANQPTLEQQAAGAFHGDIGVTTPLHPDENCGPGQVSCTAAPSGGAPEVEQPILDDMTFYLTTLAVPGRRRPFDPEVQAGRALFLSAGCAACHTPTLVTGTDPAFPEVSGQTIHPFTDLLLHDMGPELADGRPDFLASGSEWRTPPLWGVGLVETVNGHRFFLHDGRARGFAEAILWHGGEAAAARARFRAMTAAERDALERFLEDL